MTRTHRRNRRPLRVQVLSAAISMALMGQANAQSSPFVRRGVDPGAQAARIAQQQGLPPGQATQLGQKSLQAFQRAAQARSAMDAAQAAARAAAAASSAGNDIPDGLGKGGLQMVDGAIVDPGAIRADDPRLGQNNIWLGAKKPTQTSSGGNTDVTVEQTQKKAILNWETFNVGKHTTLTFDQSAGGKQAGQWIALNRVNDPNAAPSRILGSIKAQGQVYVLNRNGVIFGGTSQVNTRSLLVSSLDLIAPDLATSNRTFVERGLFAPVANTNAILTGVENLQAGQRPGDIRIEAGAQLGSGSDGYMLIAAPNVSNAGTVTAKDGQVVLAAATRIQQGPLISGRDIANQLPINFENGAVVKAGFDYSGIGTLDNTGVVAVTRGDAMLVGYDLRQHGIVTATTSISRPGSIELLAIDQGTNGDTVGTGTVNVYVGGKLDLGVGSITSILPEFDGETTTSGDSADRAFALVPPLVTLLGAQVRFRPDSMVLAPGAQVNIFGKDANPDPSRTIGRPSLINRIWMDNGATINVAGLADVQLDMSSNLIDIPRVGQNELADSPLQRDGALFRKQVIFDRRETGVREDGLPWVGSPLLNALGYVDQVPRKIDELLIDGGTVNITGHDFVMNDGAKIDLDGGFLHFRGGMVETQRLLGSDGRIHDLATADPSQTYLGFAGEQRVNHSRWGVTQTFSSPLIGSRRYYESDYVQGGDAGSLNIKLTASLTSDPGTGDETFVLSKLLLAGDLSAQAVSGRYQRQFGNPAEAGALKISTGTAVRIGDERVTVPDGFGIETPVATLPGNELPLTDSANPSFWTTLSTDAIADAGFRDVAIADSTLVRVDRGANLRVADGGSIALDTVGLDLQGSLTAHAGKIDLQSDGGAIIGFSSDPNSPPIVFGRGDIVVGADARLDVSGRWVNDDQLRTDMQTGKAFINGGSISLRTSQNYGIPADGGSDPVDGTGSILIASGAVLDASGGGYVNPDGQLATSDGVPLGRGGDITLQTYIPQPSTGGVIPYYVNLPPQDDRTGLLQFQGADLRADGFAGGGTLTLRALGIQIGGDAPADARILHLGGDFFDGKGFGGYNLTAEQDATITAGTEVRVSQRNLIPNIDALRNAATGTDIHAGLGSADRNAYVSRGQLDAYHRPATDFSLRAGDYLGFVAGNPTFLPATGTLLLDRGASLSLDAGADVTLASRGQLTVLGDITARGGSITLTGDTTPQGGLAKPPGVDPPYVDPGKSVWLGADSRLDVSGIALVDPLKPLQSTDRGRVQPRDGAVLDGGSITLTNDSGYVVVEQGAQLDLSGARDAFDLPTDAGQLDSDDILARQPVWSDGGTLSLAASGGLFFDGQIRAAGGDARARGGELRLLPAIATSNVGVLQSATGIVFTQSESRMPKGLRPGDVVEPGRDAPSGLLYFAADRLDGSGIDTLIVGNQAPVNGQPGEPPLAPIGFSGDVDLSLRRALVFNAPLYMMLPAGGSDLAVPGTDNQVHLSAEHVGFNGFRPAINYTAPVPTLAQPGATSLTVDAGFLDLGGQVVLSNVGTANFNSRGDLRFHTPAAYGFENADDPVPRQGELLTAGDLNFKAAQLYPASGETFLVRALGALDPVTSARADTRITIAPNGDSVLPLSAGGTLAFDATTIEQNGTLRAPGGRIVLGVGEPDGDAARAVFGDRDLVATRSVRLGAGSLTSASLEGATLPYGTTVDGSQWRYDASPIGGNADLSAPPQKRIELGGADVELADGATVDLSGGGDLQAVEWVPGTGGSRDVLSPYNTSYANGSSEQVPLYPDERGVYAIVPGVQSPVAATDAVFDRGASPVDVGRSVFLSGVPGLPDGVYTLLPAKYATLPGAFRVVQRPDTQDATSRQNLIAPDGTAVVSGHFVDALTGARDARSTLFDVQSRDVWRQYSEYTFTSGNAFFSVLAAKKGTAVPQLGRDAGQLVLAATQQLGLGATIKSAAGKDGAGAQIDIASRALQVRDGDHAAREGYVQLDVADLNALGGGSLLIGGTRQQTAEGSRIDVLADSVVVSNGAADPLKAPELLLVANAGSDPGDGLHVDAGSVIQASGDLSANSVKPIVIGVDADADAGIAGISGDGALLRVSNAGEAPVIRHNVPAFDQAQGQLSVGAGAQLLGGASLTLDSTGDTNVSADAVLQGKTVLASAGNVRFVSGDADPGTGGLVIGDDSLARFADADRVTLRSYGSMDFIGDIDLQVDNALTLSAGVFAGNGGDVSLGADRLTLINALDAATTDGTEPVAGGTLRLHGREVAFGAGDKSLSGFGGVAVDADEAVIVRDRGTFDFGALDVAITAPVLLADAGADNTLRTTGALDLVRGAGTASKQAPLGGAITLVGGDIDSDALIRANAGSVTLQATDGDVRLNDGSVIDVSGVEKKFFDVSAYAPGGSIALASDQGTVRLARGATLDFSAPAKGGNAGDLSISAPTQTAELLGTLKGAAPKGQGGSFDLDIGGAVDLDALSDTLAASGVNDAISVLTRTGNLVLSADNTLKAREVTLIADGGADAQQRDAANGNVVVDGTIDASGRAGGSIDLWGRHGLSVNGQLLAKGSATDQRGGAVTLGTSGRANGELNADYGYQNVDAADAGVIALGNDAWIDVSGGSAGGLSGGTVDFRAPLLVDGDVNVTIADGAKIAGAREVGLEAYAVWSTSDLGNAPSTPGGDPSKYFDGIIDPAGWYNAQGQLVAGTWTDRAGTVLAAPTTPEQTAEYLEKYFFTPTAANAAHSGFYGYRDDAAQTPGTLMGFVQNPGFAFESRFANIENFRARPGIELRNPDPNVNGGAISVLTSWNLASGATRDALDFRYNGSAPVLTLRAEDDVVVEASLSDGFYQLRNPYSAGGPTGTYDQAASGYQAVLDTYNYTDFSPFIPTPEALGDSAEAMQYYGQYLQFLALLDKPQPELGSNDSAKVTLVDGALIYYTDFFGIPTGEYAGQPAAPAAPTSPAGYTDYLSAYERYLLDVVIFFNGTGQLPTFHIAELPVLGPLIPGVTINRPTLQASLDNPLPLATSALIGGDSSRYRIVAGADFTSTLPDAFRRASQGGDGGDVVLDGHQRYQEPDQKDVLLPTVIRTGTGSIDIAAAQDVRFADALSPASIYTAGRPGEGTADGADVSIVRSGNANPGVVVGAQANAEAAGDIDLRAGRDILGNRQLFDVDGSITGVVGNYIGQYWWPWMQVGNPLTADQSAVSAAMINFGGFAQGVLSTGGNVSVDAGRDIRELSVSLPVSYVPTAAGKTLYGGGNLSIDAGRDVLGGDYFLGKGDGELAAGGSLGSAFTLRTEGPDLSGNAGIVSSTVDPIFALQDGHWAVQARSDVNIGGIVNPGFFIAKADGTPTGQRATLDYSADSNISISAVNGDLRLNTLKAPGLLFNYGFVDSRGRPELSDLGFDFVLPAEVEAASLNGGLSIERGARLYPSATGQLTLLADGDIRLFNDTLVRTTNGAPVNTLTLLDAPDAYAGDDRSTSPKLNLHRNDERPVQIYSLQGDIVGGFESDGFYINRLTLDLPKPAQIRAGRDIVNLDLRGQNYDRSDVTSVIAGRDLYYTPIQGAPYNESYSPRWSWLQIGGPGTFEVQAGRNLGPFTSANEALISKNVPSVDPNSGGIRSIGNRQNPGLPTDGATIAVRYGVAPGIAGTAFAGRYLDPASVDTTDAYRAWLSDFVLQIENDARAKSGQSPLAALTPSEAWAAFQQLPVERRQLLVDRVFLDVLKRVGEDYANPDSPDFNQYARGYAAIDTLFPSALGYTANNLEGGENGAATLIATGDFDMRGSTVQTERGGDIRILGPGGGVQVGSVSAPPQVSDANGNVIIGPNQQGILAIGEGDIGMFNDRSVQLAQSRIFTQRGGDLVIWSSNGDINAGKGAKTSSEKPKVTYICDLDRFCFVNANGQVSGAGIATLQTVPDAKPGDAVLVAPRGTVDAGDAGIRVSGNLIVASQFVANADNIEVQGDTVGVPGARTVDTGALTAASSAASAVADAAGSLAEQRPMAPRDLPAIISVQVIGFGNCAPDDPRCKVNR